MLFPHGPVRPSKITKRIRTQRDPHLPQNRSDRAESRSSGALRLHSRAYDAAVPTLTQSRAQWLRIHPSDPLITDCTQGRVELSHATFDNWVTKTVNFLQLECDVEPGARIAVRLPLHWMAAVWLVSAWEAGADAVLDGSPADLVVATGSGDILVVPDPLGMAGPPAGSSAEWFFPADVRAMPDQLVLPDPDPGAVSGMSAEELSAAATDYAGRLGLRPGDRLATKLPLDHLEGVLAAIATPLAVGASVVYGDAAGEAPTATA